MARYIREQAGEGMQFIQISHKSLLYERAEALVGVYRDRDDESSRVLTLDLTAYAQQ
jgi:structural maintenance of chromosome 1